MGEISIDTFGGRIGEPAKVGDSVLVAVGGQPHGWEALDWAAAEAAARGSRLCILHILSWPRSVDSLGYPSAIPFDAGTMAAAEDLVEQAAQRAHSIAPALNVHTRLDQRPIAAAIAAEGRHSGLIVIGAAETRRRRMSARSLPWKIARRSPCPVAVVTLGDRPLGRGSCAGGVVLWLGHRSDERAALRVAYGAAVLRGVGLTVLRSGVTTSSLGLDPLDFSGVQLQERVIVDRPEVALVAESCSAALVVLVIPRLGPAQRTPTRSVARKVLDAAGGPVLLVSTPTRS